MGALNKDTPINVYAQKGSTTKQVGMLMIYKANVIPKLRIVLVKMITDNNDKDFSLSKDFEYALKYQSFNQALLRVEVVKHQEYNLTKYEKKSNYKRISCRFKK